MGNLLKCIELFEELVMHGGKTTISHFTATNQEIEMVSIVFNKFPIINYKKEGHGF